jgi:hypothetical protein
MVENQIMDGGKGGASCMGREGGGGEGYIIYGEERGGGGDEGSQGTEG